MKLPILYLQGDRDYVKCISNVRNEPSVIFNILTFICGNGNSQGI